MNEHDDPVFEYKGQIYVRPMGRGICFVNEQGEITDDLQLEDMLISGDYHAEITIRHIPPTESEAQ